MPLQSSSEKVVTFLLVLPSARVFQVAGPHLYLKTLHGNVLALLILPTAQPTFVELTD
jgi:hypothetical protein